MSVQSSQMGVFGRVAPRESEANTHARGLFLTVSGVLLLTPDAVFIRLIAAFGFVSDISHTTTANVLVIMAVTPLFAAVMSWVGYIERPPLRT